MCKRLTLFICLGCCLQISLGQESDLRDSLFASANRLDLESSYYYGDQLDSIYAADNDVDTWLKVILDAGRIYRNKDPELGFRYFSHYRERAVTSFGEIHQSTAMMQSFIAECLHRQEKYAAALPAFEDALMIFDKAGIRNEFTGRLYHKTANTYNRFWDRSKTLDYLKKANQRFEENNSLSRMARVTCDINQALLPIGHYEEVLANARRWINHEATPERQRGILLLQVAESGLETGDRDLYLNTINQLKNLLKNHEDRALQREFNVIQGRYAEEIGAPQQAEQFYEQALYYSEFPDREKAKIYVRRGKNLLQLQSSSPAIIQFEEAFQILLQDSTFLISENPPGGTKLGPEPWLLRLCMQTGLAYLDLDKNDAGISWLNLALQQASSVRLIQSREESQFYIARVLRPALERAIATLGSGLQTDPELGDPLFHLMLAARSAVLHENLGYRFAKGQAGIPADLLILETELRRDYQLKLQQDSSAAAERIARRTDTLNRYLLQKFPALQEQQLKATSYPDLNSFRQAQLPKGHLLLLYFIGKQSSYGIAVSHQELYFSETDTSGLQSYLGFLTSGSGDGNSGYKLYEELCAVFINQVKQPVKSLLFAPDGILGNLPFESLPTAPLGTSRFKEVPWLIKQYSVSYLQHSFLYAENKKFEYKFGGFAPSYAEGNNSVLYYSAEEVENSAAIFGGKSWTGASASIDEFKKNASCCEILHIAAHGFPDNQNPDHSGLAFSGNESLQAGEIRNMNIPAALTVLSACKTGEGRIEVGEGILSLGRAFTEAGSRSIIISLWEVDDQATGEMMTRFYRFLKKGHPKDESLRLAKLSFLDADADPLTSNPTFWSSFILMGDAESLRQPYRSSALLISLIVIGVLMFVTAITRRLFLS